MSKSLIWLKIACLFIFCLPASNVNGQNRQPVGVWSDVKIAPQLNTLELFRGLIREAKFFQAWNSSPQDGLGHYIHAAIALDPGCKPGNPIAAYRAIASLDREIADPSRVSSLVPESARQQLALLSGEDVAVLQRRLKESIAGNLDSTELQIVEWSVEGSRQFDPYPCYASDPPPSGTINNIPKRIRIDAALDAYVCLDASRRFQEEQSSPPRSIRQRPDTFFRRARLIRVSFPGVPDSLKEKLVRFVVTSMRLWYLACSNCTPDSAAILAVDDQIWIMDNFVLALRAATNLSQNPNAIPKMGDPVGTTLNELLPTKRFGEFFGRQSRDGRSASDYIAIGKDDPAIVRLCSAGAETVDARLKGLRAALCTPDATAGSYEITLSQDGKMSCLGNRVIACGLFGKSVEINSSEFKFLNIGQKEVVFGSGRTELDLLKVMLHETGHWIGFEHTVGVRHGDLMSATYTPNMCLSDRNVRDMETISYDSSKKGIPSALLYGE